MKISVIIMAYNRRNFLRYAIYSVLNQSLDRSSFEILLIKNFKDEQIDTLCFERGIQVILTPNVPIGEYISIALKNSSGEVLCFLDDDDAFEENKLETIYNEFSSNQDLMFMRNNWSLIDSEGGPIREHSRETTTSMVPVEYYDINYVIKKVGIEYRWNMSCISVRREIFCGFEEYLPSIIAAQDLIIFYMAASRSKVLARCNLPLTRYRVHENSMTKLKGPNNDALREYNSLNLLINYLGDGIVKEDLKKAAIKMRSISVWDGSQFSRRELRLLLNSYLQKRLYNLYDLFVLLFIFIVVTLGSTVGGKGIRFIRKGIDIFWSYEENY